MQPRILQIQGTQLLEAPSTPATHATKAGPVTITQPALAASTAAEHPTTSHHGQLPPLSNSSCSSWQKTTRPACSPLSTSRRALHTAPRDLVCTRLPSFFTKHNTSSSDPIQDRVASTTAS